LWAGAEPDSGWFQPPAASRNVRPNVVIPAPTETTSRAFNADGFGDLASRTIAAIYRKICRHALITRGCFVWDRIGFWQMSVSRAPWLGSKTETSRLADADSLRHESQATLDSTACRDPSASLTESNESHQGSHSAIRDQARSAQLSWSSPPRGCTKRLPVHDVEQPKLLVSVEAPSQGDIRPHRPYPERD
jgi:hypothetical protein